MPYGYGYVQDALRGLQGTVGGLFADEAARRKTAGEQALAMGELRIKGEQQAATNALRQKAIEHEAKMTAPITVGDALGIMNYTDEQKAAIPDDLKKQMTTLKDFAKTTADFQQFKLRETAEENRSRREEQSRAAQADRALRASAQQFEQGERRRGGERIQDLWDRMTAEEQRQIRETDAYKKGMKALDIEMEKAKKPLVTTQDEIEMVKDEAGNFVPKIVKKTYQYDERSGEWFPITTSKSGLRGPRAAGENGGDVLGSLINRAK